MQSASEESVIILTTRMHPLTIPVFFVFRTIVAIDGVSSQLPWGEHTFQVTPGTHEVRVSLGKNITGQMGGATITVLITKGEVAHLKYRGPFNYLMKDKIGIVR